MTKIKVLIIDDSALMRQLLQEILSSDRNIEAVGSCRGDRYAARDKIMKLNPDVLTLDVEMPHGRAHVSRKTDGQSPDAGRDGFIADGTWLRNDIPSP